MTGVAFVYNIVVKPEFQDQCIGTLLVEMLEDLCRSEGIEFIRALIPQSNAKLRNYFKELVFSPSTTINCDNLSRERV